jgi:hypothetical protein
METNTCSQNTALPIMDIQAAMMKMFSYNSTIINAVSNAGQTVASPKSALINNDRMTNEQNRIKTISH